MTVNKMEITLRLAAVYNVLWGMVAVLFPVQCFEFFGMQVPLYPQLWQCIGMIVGVYGVGYWLAADNPMVHWPIVLVGFMGKVFGPIGFSMALINEEFPLKFGLNIIFNDLIWWIPFFLILRATLPNNFILNSLSPFKKMYFRFIK
jgi:small multidrug resistance pump|tara:strand:- start:1472 stop:1909 length:438 start_codon:yes stop_codon:yes gene_type:complete